MKICKNLILLIIYNILIVTLINAQEKSENNQTKYFKITPDHIIDITIDAGIGIYIGNFYEHLNNDGAYTITPIIDIDISLFIIKYLGFKASIGSGSVIHPYSEPIEGTIIYMGLGIFFQYDWKYAYIKIFSGVGFQHTTMLLQWYVRIF